MAHFAKLNENNIVIDIIVLNNEELLDNGVESEQKGIEFLTNWSGYSKWKQLSYNKSYAGVGYTYNEVKNIFIPPRPSPDYVYNESTNSWYSIVPINITNTVVLSEPL